MFAQHDTIGTDSVMVLLSKVGKNELNSGGSSVKVSCDLVSLNLLVGSYNADDDGQSRFDAVSEVLVLKVQTRY